jgi:hypothetical protein
MSAGPDMPRNRNSMVSMPSTAVMSAVAAGREGRVRGAFDLDGNQITR